MGAVDGGAWGAARVVRGFVAADEGCCGVCAHFFLVWLVGLVVERERWGFGGCGRWGVGIYICGSFYLEGDGWTDGRGRWRLLEVPRRNVPREACYKRVICEVKY